MVHDRILLDIETQRDFFEPGQNCYTPDASSVARSIYSLFSWARINHVPVISTVLRVRTNEHGPLTSAPHCVEGTDGEKKLSKTLLRHRINLGLRNVTDLPANLFTRYQQVIFEKRDTDIFCHARLERLITELAPATFVLCGVGVSHGLVQATVGLRNRGFGVIVASDAILDLGHPLREMARLRMEAKGAIFVPASEIIAPAPRRRAAKPRAAAKSGPALQRAWRK